MPAIKLKKAAKEHEREAAAKELEKEKEKAAEAEALKQVAKPPPKKKSKPSSGIPMVLKHLDAEILVDKRKRSVSAVDQGLNTWYD